MTENESRRGARRQQRGLQRQAEILAAAGVVFAQAGYGDATTNAIAANAGMSPGSLYQYFPNKEAIANALAHSYKDELHTEWDDYFSAKIAALPLSALTNLLVDSLLAFNEARPGFSVLFFGEDISPELAAMGSELHDGMIARFSHLIGLRAPDVPTGHRELVANVILKIYKAFIPGMVTADAGYRQQLVGEMKRVMYGYLASYFGNE